MADILCAICREPWDGYGVEHGDMLPWEAVLFKKGAGCPCCEGESPEGVTLDAAREAQARSIIFDAGTDDPPAYESMNTLGLDAPRVPWERPEDSIVHSCQSCGAEIRRNIDSAVLEVDEDTHDHAVGLYWQGGRFQELHHHDRNWEDILIACIARKGKLHDGPPAAWLLNGRFHCPGCAENCGECGELFPSEDLILPEGKCHVGDAVCEDCLGTIEYESTIEGIERVGSRFARDGAAADWAAQVFGVLWEGPNQESVCDGATPCEDDVRAALRELDLHVTEDGEDE